MSDQSSLLVEKLWRLKRRIDKGQCPSVDFVHLNVLLREPNYRNDVLMRVEANGTPELQALAREIMANDDGRPLMAKSSNQKLQASPVTPQKRRGWFARHALVLVPVIGAAVATVAGFTAFENRNVRISADITADTVWESGHRYTLENTVFVEGANLTIEPGVTIEGEPGSALVVTSSAKLFARGSRNQPVVFTSSKEPGARARGDWGGVVLLGKAPVNEPNARIEGVPENDTRGQFGGSDTQHSCGVVQYTRIEFAGFEVYQNNELNGLTLGGCGSNTIIQNVQVHRALDDGIEMFGGTVDLKNILVTGAADDSIDWDWGWRGRVQFAIIQQYRDVGDNAFEGDNNGSSHSAMPRSEPTFYNVTLYGSGRSAKEHRAIMLREGSGGHFHNMIIDSYAIEALDTRDEVTALVGMNALTFSHNLLANNGRLGNLTIVNETDDDDFGFNEELWIRSPELQNTVQVETGLQPSVTSESSPHFRPRSSVRAMTAKRPPKAEFFDESAMYQGAVNPRATSTWLDDWTAFPES